MASHGSGELRVYNHEVTSGHAPAFKPVERIAVELLEHTQHASVAPGQKLVGKVAVEYDSLLVREEPSEQWDTGGKLVR